jgi:hypothetical protein
MMRLQLRLENDAAPAPFLGLTLVLGCEKFQIFVHFDAGPARRRHQGTRNDAALAPAPALQQVTRKA